MSIQEFVAAFVGVMTVVASLFGIFRYISYIESRVAINEKAIADLIMSGSPGVAVIAQRVTRLESTADEFRDRGSPVVVEKLSVFGERIASLETWMEELKSLVRQGVIDDAGHQRRIAQLEAHERITDVNS